MSDAEIATGDAADHHWDISKIEGTYNSLTPNMDEGKAKHQLVESPQGDHSAKDEMYGCRIFGYPRWLQRLASLKFFIAILCLAVFLDALLVSLLEGTLTTVEVRYQLSASQLGLPISLFTAGSVVSTIVVTHFGGRPASRRQVWIGACVVVSGIGVFLPTLPQFVFSPYQPQTSLVPMSSDDSNTSLPHDGRCLSDAVHGEEEDDLCESQDHQQIFYENNMFFIINLIGAAVTGVGYGPLIPLSLAYVDDNGGTETAGLLSGQ